MPRVLPALADDFQSEVDAANMLIKRLEAAQISLSESGKPYQIGIAAIELTYELAFLRMFLAWEIFLEEVFLRLICGYAPKGGTPEPLAQGQSYRRTIDDAETAILGGKAYRLWHNPSEVIKRTRGFLSGSNFELVIASKQSDLTDYAAIRHRIAHAQEHARVKFDGVTMTLAARRYRGSRPGRFLRDWKTRAMPPTRYVAAISADLAALARQICP
jgi:hypothetical protein